MTNEYLRHTLSTINYRFRKTVKNADDGFGTLSLGKGSRTPDEILNHMYQVLKATRVFIQEESRPAEKPEQLGFKAEAERFLKEIQVLDKVLSKNELPVNYAKKLLQGPLSDILTHIGQISMLSRFYGIPIPPEDFSAAEINTGT
ncbi:MAG: hypothetical protein HEP71_27530 [Roseivirga sp.]|nr:hypothetical protein [Roseivirga sp.]